MSLNDLLDKIVAIFGAVLPKLDIAAHRGRFDTDELKRFMINAPGMRIAVLGLSNPQPVSGGACDWTVRFGAMLVTKDKGGLPRHTSATNILQTVLLTALHNNWDFDWVFPAEPANARNLYSQALDRAGALIWAIEWDQTVRLERPAPEGALQVVPDELYIGFGIEDENGGGDA